MKIISVSNQKGGVGKTTLAYHIANLLAKDSKVLCVDIDSQGNFTDYFLGEIEIKDKNNIIKLFQNKKDELQPLKVNDNLDLVGTDIQLSEFDSKADLTYYFILQKYLKIKKEKYDYVIIDTPPNLGLFTMNSLLCAHYLLIPMDSSKGALKGLKTLMKDYNEIKEDHNKKLNLMGIVLNSYAKNTKASTRTKDKVMELYPGVLFETEIPRTTKVMDACEEGTTLNEYDSRHDASKAFVNLVKEIKFKMGE